MHWYKRAQANRELGYPYIPDQKEYLYMTGQDDDLYGLLEKERDKETFDKNEIERNVIHHKKILEIMPLEEEIERLKELLKDPMVYVNEKEKKDVEIKIRRAEKKIVTIMSRNIQL